MEEVLALPELIHEVATHLNLYDRFNFALSNKKAWGSRTFFGEQTGKYNNFQLKLDQQEVLQRIESSKKPVIFLYAGTSFGKTAIVWINLLASFKPNEPIASVDRILLFVPAKCIRLWVEELQRIFPQYLNNDPYLTNVVVNDPSKPKHKAVVDANMILSNWKVMLTSAKRFERPYYMVHQGISLIRLALQQFGRIAIDEAHKEYFALRYIDPRTNPLLLVSATDINLSYNTDDVERIEIKNEVIAEHIPDYSYNYLKDGYKDFLKNGTYTKLVIFTYHDQGIYSIKTLKQYIPADVTIYKFSSSLRPIKEFHADSGRAVLFTTYGVMAVGHNLLVEEALFINPNEISYQNLYQSCSRLLRVTNRNKVVKFHVSTEKSILLRFKLALVDMKRKHGIDFKAPIIRITNGLVDSVLKKYKLDAWEVDAIEFVWLVLPGTTNKGLKELYAQRGLDKDPRKS